MATFETGRLPELSDFPAEQRSAAVELLLGICHQQQAEIVNLRAQVQHQAQQIQVQSEQIALQAEQIQRLKDEIAILKGEKGRPNIKPSGMNKDTESDNGGGQVKRGKPIEKKTQCLKIQHEKILEPKDLPPGSQFKGYEDYVVQDIEIGLNNTRYRRARYQTLDGVTVIGELPEAIRGSHFGPVLQSYILSQYYQQHVPQNLILKQLWELGIHISAGALNEIITENKERFHAEKDQVLQVGLKVSTHINTDDTGARHQGKNGYCTHIGNEFFACFISTASKSRINFLEILQAGETEYVVDDSARQYMLNNRLPKVLLKLFTQDQTFPNKLLWELHLEGLKLSQRAKRIATEGALTASLLKNGRFHTLAIMSDDAGQFNVTGFINALCWVHAERHIHTIIPYFEENRLAQQLVRDQIWNLYRDLKAYKSAPTIAMKDALARRFDEIFTQKTCFQTLNLALGRIYANKKELLLVLDRPEIPLHNNLSENDIRDYVKKRKISATTRSDAGRKARDTMLSLKKTCQKLKISFWGYLLDRISGKNIIPPLPQLIRAAAQSP
jgi:hypothetical protein